MDLATLIESHGYWVLALGGVLEGETVLLLAGYAAHRGYLSLTWVLVIAGVAGFAGDQFYFWLGRRHGRAVLQRFPSVSRQANRLRGLIDRYRTWAVIGVRFAYGLRIAGPILIGTSTIAAGKFALLNAVGAALWAAVMIGLGWGFGQAIEAVLGDVRRIEALLLLCLAAAGLILWWLQRRRHGA
jgi:membrane protein DedA with SNARE-associated domain